MAEDAKKKLQDQIEKLKKAKEAAKVAGQSLAEQAATEEAQQEETGESQPD